MFEVRNFTKNIQNLARSTFKIFKGFAQ